MHQAAPTIEKPQPSSRRAVIKLGTRLLTSRIGQLNTSRIHKICIQVAQLQAQKHAVIIVSSGAVGLGMGALGLKQRPTKLSSLQKCASVGQSILIETWQKGFSPLGLTAAQLLLTREDVSTPSRYTSLKALIEELLDEGIIPIVNENDSVSTEEITFGDNDVLSALVARAAGARLLLILSTVEGLIDRAGTGRCVEVVKKITPEIEAMASGPESMATVGGMITKVQAAKIATSAGCTVFLGSGSRPQIISQAFNGTATGTWFEATPENKS